MVSTGERIKYIRLELGETLEQFGKRFDPPANRSLVSGWENGRYLPSPKRLKVISELGGIQVEDLVSTNSIGERIKDIRLENGMSKTEFGKLFETTGSLVNKWETNQVVPTEKRLKEIAELGGIQVKELVSTHSVGERIKRIREEELGVSMREFASMIDDKAKSGTVANWETGKNLPNLKRLKLIAELGGMSVEELRNESLLGKRIKRIRVGRKETLEEFAKNIIKVSENSVKTTKSNVSRWEKGENKPNDVTLQAIAELGNTTVDQLLNSNPLSDYSTEELLEEIERRENENETTDK